MVEKYFLFVDESGDPSLDGGSTHFVFGGFLISEKYIGELENSIESVCKSTQTTFPPHFVNIAKNKKPKFAQSLINVTPKGIAFSVISNKSTLGNFPSLLNRYRNYPYEYPHKCFQFMLEEVCAELLHRSISPENLHIIFEICDRHNRLLRNSYSTLGKYIEDIVKTPMGAKWQKKRIALMYNFDSANITGKRIEDSPVLAIADMIAHANYSLVNSDIDFRKRTNLLSSVSQLYCRSPRNSMKRFYPIVKWNDMGWCDVQKTKIKLALSQ